MILLHGRPLPCEMAVLRTPPTMARKRNSCFVHSGAAALPDGLADEIFFQLEALPAEGAQGVFLRLVLSDKHCLKEKTMIKKPTQLFKTSQRRTPLLFKWYYASCWVGPT